MVLVKKTCSTCLHTIPRRIHHMLYVGVCKKSPLPHHVRQRETMLFKKANNIGVYLVEP